MTEKAAIPRVATPKATAVEVCFTPPAIGLSICAASISAALASTSFTMWSTISPSCTW
jgi:hypothetical protein